MSRAVAGQRTAINLAAIEASEITRGMTLTPPGLFTPTTLIDCAFDLLDSAIPLKHRAPVHFHSGTAEVEAQVRMLRGTDPLAPGSRGYLRIYLREPLLLLPGDRFIARMFSSPVVTIGGGVGARQRPESAAAQARGAGASAAVGERIPRAAVGALCGGGRDRLDGDGCRSAGLAAGGPRRRHGQRARGPNRRHAPCHSGGGGRSRVGPAQRPSGSAGVHRGGYRPNCAVRWLRFTARTRFCRGCRALRRPCLPFCSKPRSPTARTLSRKVRSCGWPRTALQLKAEEDDATLKMEALFRDGGLAVPALQEVLAQSGLDGNRSRNLLQLLLRDGRLVRVSPEMIFHRDAIQRLRELLSTHKGERFAVAEFKEWTGISRKYAIPLLEFLDRERVTRRENERRLVL